MAGNKRGFKANGKMEEMPKAKITKEALKRSSRLFHYMGGHRWKFYLGLVFLALTGATALIFPYLLGQLIGVIGEGETKPSPELADHLGEIYLTDLQSAELLNIAKVVGIQMLILFTLQAIFSFFRVYMFSQATENMLANLRQSTFARLMRMPMEFFSKNQAAELNSRISSDITQIGDTLTTGVAEFLRQAIIVVGGLIWIFWISPKMALIMLAVIPPVALITVFFGRKIRKHSRNVQDKIAESNIIVGEGLQGITNVKSFTNEAYEISRYRKSNLVVVMEAIKYAILRGTFFSFIIFCLFGSIMVMVYVGVRMTVTHE
ncbi:MAG TPA: ABC transporter transmembrane domain-containing protein, partial [Bacteroidia bacterium]|nr:ABC transporter transmembrane domain-containing protein [Bacteroidia bacterium]